MKNIYHAEMALLIRREKEIHARLLEIKKEFGIWKDRVELARKTGRDELANQAEERLDTFRVEAAELRDELRLTEAKKKDLSYASRRPTGVEVQRAEALLDSFRESGLVDPDEASLESEFEKLRREGFDDEQ